MLPSKKVINYWSIKYHKFLIRKFSNIFNYNNNNVKITSKTYNNSIKTVNHKTENLLTNCLSVLINMMRSINLCSCNKFYIIKPCTNFEIQNDKHI